DELTRGALLLRASEAVPAGELEGLVEDVYQRGDTRERQAVLMALALLPEPGRFLPLAVESCRTSIQPLFEAIACENPYPAAHFPEPSFNQMVLKALFVGVPLARIVGLRGRITGELRRMAADYASERRAAGRPVPSDIGALVDAPAAP
ncbi:MAG: EboA domain-containing protein, partial [Candidatus Rokuibacteriota bacterium]